MDKDVSKQWFARKMSLSVGGDQKTLLRSSPYIPKLPLQCVPNAPQSHSYRHPFRYTCKYRDKNKRNYRKSHALSDRVHPNMIELDSERQILYDKFMNAWIDQFRYENYYGFNSMFLYCKVRLFELLSATQRQQSPNKVTTAIVCDLFNRLCESPRYKEILSPFKNELFSAIFVDYNSNSNQITNHNTNANTHSNDTDTFLSYNTYFNEYHDLCQQKRILSKKLSLLQSRLKDQTELGDDGENDGAAKLIDHILSMWRFDRKQTAFRAWKQYVVIKQQRIRELCGKYQTFQISAKKVFLRWRTVSINTKKERIQMDIYRYRKHISVMENNLHFYKLKYNDLKKTSSEHIQRLLCDLSKWRSKALAGGKHRSSATQHHYDDGDDDDADNEENNTLINKWKRYFCGYFSNLLELTRDKLNDIIKCGNYYEPMQIIRDIKTQKHNIATSYNKLSKMSDLTDFSSEDVLLNWINWRLLPGNLGFEISNFSKDFCSCKVFFVLLNLFRSDLFNLRSVLEENSDELRAEKVIDILNKMNINDGPLMHAHDIIEGKADLNFVMLVRLMLLYSGITVGGTEQFGKALFKSQYALLEQTITRCNKLRRSRKVRDIEHLHKFANECYRVVNEVEDEIENLRQRHTIWVNVCSRIASGAQIYVTARMRDKPRSVNDEIQRAVKKEFGHISHIKLADILNKYKNPNKELQALKHILSETTDEIQRIFTYYASNSGAGDMNLPQYLSFITDVRIKGKNLPNSQIKKIFEIANLDESEMNVDAAMQNADDENDETEENEEDEDENDIKTTFELFQENPDDTLVGHEFIECLVRIAHRKFCQLAPNLAKCYELLLEQHLRKYACHSNKFRDIILSPEIQNIFVECNNNLKKIFIYYSKLSFKKLNYDIPSNITGSAGDWLCLRMRSNEFGSMLKDCRLIGSSLTQQLLDTTLNKIGKHDDGLMDYAQFCEALAAVACLRNPDPFIPLKAKILIFVNLDLINPLVKGQLMKNAIKR